MIYIKEVLILTTGMLAILPLGAQKKSDKYKIVWNQELNEGREQYLSSDGIDSANSVRPNVIIILADDLGQTDISLYGNKLISTPNIDAIGKSGVTFTEGYVSSPVSSPSRACLLTGRYQQRFGYEIQPSNRYVRNKLEYLAFRYMPLFKPLIPIKRRAFPSKEDILKQGLPPSEITLAEVFKKNGYNTAIIGKWHLGSGDFAKPCERGFDYQYSFNEAFAMYADVDDPNIVNMRLDQYADKHQWKTAESRTGDCAITKNCVEIDQPEKYLTDKLTDEALAFMARNREKPFFLYLPYNAPHVPLQAQKNYYEQFSHIEDPVKRVYMAMIKNLDDQVGRILEYLKLTQIEENTIIVFLSDNGGARYTGVTDNFPYRGGKFTNFEGGLRVPFMMKWKGKIKEETIYTSPVISLDVFSTVCNAAQIQLPKDREYDGVDLVSKVQSNSPAHDKICWRTDGNKAIRKGKWKLIINELSGQKALYDMGKDEMERVNLYDTNPVVVQELWKDYEEWERGMIEPLWPGVVNYLYEDEIGKYLFAL